MPVVTVHVCKDSGGRSKPYNLVIPRRVTRPSGGHEWEWDEVAVVRSDLDEVGFGLAPRNTAALDWSHLRAPVLLPYLGRETQCGSAAEIDILSRILHGDFDVIPFGSLNAPSGHRWEHNGVYLEPAPIPDGDDAASTASDGAGAPASVASTPRRPRTGDSAPSSASLTALAAFTSTPNSDALAAVAAFAATPGDDLAALVAFGRRDRSQVQPAWVASSPVNGASSVHPSHAGEEDDVEASPPLRVGERVVAQYGVDDDELWFEGSVLAVDAQSGSIDVLYDDGEREERKPPSRVRRLRSARSGGGDGEGGSVGGGGGGGGGSSCCGVARLPPETPIVQVAMAHDTEGGGSGELRAERGGAALASDVREGGVIQLRRDVASVVYLPKAAALELLHVPPRGQMAALAAWRQCWPSWAHQASSEGLRLPSAPRKSGPWPQIPQNRHGLGARPRSRRDSRCV